MKGWNIKEGHQRSLHGFCKIPNLEETTPRTTHMAHVSKNQWVRSNPLFFEVFFTLITRCYSFPASRSTLTPLSNNQRSWSPPRHTRVITSFHHPLLFFYKAHSLAKLSTLASTPPNGTAPTSFSGRRETRSWGTTSSALRNSSGSSLCAGAGPWWGFRCSRWRPRRASSGVLAFFATSSSDDRISSFLDL